MHTLYTACIDIAVLCVCVVHSQNIFFMKKILVEREANQKLNERRFSVKITLLCKIAQRARETNTRISNAKSGEKAEASQRNSVRILHANY